MDILKFMRLKIKMFFLFGWGKQTRKYLSEQEFELCRYCHKSKLKLVEITSWATIFFIPIIPYKTKYLLACGNCECSYELSDELVDRIRDKDEGDDFI